MAFWESDLWENLRFSSTEYRRFQFGKHFHDYYTLILIEKGVNNGFTLKHPYQIGPGSVLIINPGEIHAGNSIQEKKLRFTSLLFYPKFLDVISEKLGHAIRHHTTFVNTPIYDLSLNTAISTLIRSTRAGQSILAQETSIIQLFHILLERYTLGQFSKSEKSPRLYLRKAVEFIKENHTANFSLEQISNYSGISQFHLIREFKNTYQQTPYQFLRNFRIEKSKKLLTKKRPITQIALELGFFDHSHFIKSFVQNEGILPSTYQNLSGS